VILPEDTALTLGPRLSEIGAELMAQTLDDLREGRISPRKQEEQHASFAPILKKEDGLIDFRRRATDVWNRLRGFQPWPGAYTTFRGKKFTLTAARPAAQDGAQLVEGEIVVTSGRLIAGFAGGTLLELLEVQPEGRKRMPAKDFVNGYHPQSGERLGEQE
jgi:methionyl-tRNA formyltransferase